jgi:single-strand DNA-binding protein
MIGNLTRDPELTTVGADNIPVCKFGIAVNRPRSKNRDEVDFFNVSVWRAQGENCAKYLSKGKKVGITGSIQTRQYENKDGARMTSFDIVADDVEFLTPKGSAGDEQSYSKNDEMMPIQDDNLPF